MLCFHCCSCLSSFFASSSIVARREHAFTERARWHCSLLLSLPLQLLRFFFNPRSTRACFAERARWHCSLTAVAAAPVSSLLLQSSLDASLLALSAHDCTPLYCYRCRSSFFAPSSTLAQREHVSLSAHDGTALQLLSLPPQFLRFFFNLRSTRVCLR